MSNNLKSCCIEKNEKEDLEVEISVIVPIYNVEKYLRRCLNSLCAQRFQAVEFLLINDGSTDRSGAICDEYSSKDSRFKVFHKLNGGLSSARNYGIDNSRGKYLLFLDSDDWVTADFCSASYSIAKSKNADLVMFMYRIAKNSHVYFDRKCDIDEGYKTWSEGIDIILGAGGVYAWNKLYKRTLFNDIRYPQGRVFEDSQVTWQLIYLAERIYFTRKPLYFYFMRRNSIIHQKNRCFAKDRFEMKMQMNDGLRKVGYSSYNLTCLLVNAALSYIIQIKEKSCDEDGVRARDILNTNHFIPKEFSWKKRLLLFLYFKNMWLFNFCCILTGKRLA